MGGREGIRQSRDESPSPGWRAAKKGLGGPCRQLCLPGMRRDAPLPPVLGVVKVELQVVAARLLYFRGEGYGDHFPGVNTELEEESRAETLYLCQHGCSPSKGCPKILSHSTHTP